MGKATPDAAAGAAGLLLVDKPAGLTSHDVVAIVRRATRTRRVGHTGTLDPFATGLLVVLIGRGTRLIPYVEGEPKVYEATIRFGAEMDTDDITGATVREAAVPADDATIAEAIARLTGDIDQVPPAYSAKQVDGRRAYDAARKGAPLDLAPVRVTVHRWDLLEKSGNDYRVRITCGGGTYIRALARDLGRYTGSAAHLAELRRTGSGHFAIADAIPLDAIADGDFELQPLRNAIPSMPSRVMATDELGRVLHGNAIDVVGETSEHTALLDARDDLIAIAAREGNQLRPRLVLQDA
jgi:tRNA pseudouridine55 synthase